jgi:hypothetical protein
MKTNHSLRKCIYILVYFVVLVMGFILLTYIITKPLNFVIDKSRNIDHSKMYFSTVPMKRLNKLIKTIKYQKPYLFEPIIKPMLNDRELN